MKSLLDATGTTDGLAKVVEECLSECEATGLLILAGDANGFTPRSVDHILQDIPLPVVGGTFPAIIHGQDLLERGTVVAALPRRPHVQVVPGLSGACDDFEDVLDEDLVGDDGRTMIVLVDGFATCVNTLLSSLFHVFGLAVSYLGGGAGSLQIKFKPCLMTNDGLIGDAAVLAVLDAECGVGVSHGMASVSGPHKITTARRNAICTLDWHPAYERFRELIHELEPGLQDRDSFPVSREFCLAVNRMGDEKVVRDPSRVEPDGALHVAPEVHAGEFVDIVRATPESTIQAAATALSLARASYRGQAPYDSVLCFDCSGRWKFLDDRFGDELDAIQDDACEVLGALTIGGEIANSGLDFLDYYNRTCVIGVMED